VTWQRDNGSWGTSRLAEPRDLAGPALFFASRAADHGTGHNLFVDGGVTLGWASRSTTIELTDCGSR
jgi:hypothetical protein